MAVAQNVIGTKVAEARAALGRFARWLDDNPHAPHADSLADQLHDADPTERSTVALLAGIRQELDANSAPSDGGAYATALQLVREVQSA